MDCSMISLPEPAYDLSPLRPGEIPLWQLVVDQFRLPMPTVHGAFHWLTVLRNGMELCRHDKYAGSRARPAANLESHRKNIAMQGAWHQLET
jgi:hypothetical protein